MQHTRAAPFIERLQARWLPQIIIFASFLAVAQLATIFYRDIGTQPALILAPQGVALAAFIIEGFIAWPAILAAALLNNLINGSPWLIAVASSIANVLQPAVALYFLRAVGFDRSFSSLKDMLAFLGVGFLATMIVPSINLLAAHEYNVLFGGTRVVSWLDVWIGNLLSYASIAPFFVRWLSPMSRRTLAQLTEAWVAIGALCVLTFFLFATPYTKVFGISLVIFFFIPLFWLALRCGPRFMTLAVFLMTTISIFGLFFGVHQPSTQTLSERVFNVAIFDLLVIAFFYILVAIEEQRKEAVRKLESQTTRLERVVDEISSTDKAKNEFIAVLGHEMRNPLASLMNAVELMKIEKPAAEEQRKLLDSMDDRIRSMARLLDDILDISRITQHKFKLVRSVVKARDVVHRAVDAVQIFMNKQSHSFIYSLPAPNVIINVDPTRIEQIVTNLLFNAAKYTPPGGRISCVSSFESGHLVVRVRDSGVGIDPSLMHKIFDPFVQINPKQNLMGGIGLGLTLAKNLAEMHGGSIGVHSDGIGSGSEFTMRLPAKLEAEHAAPVLLPPGNGNGHLLADGLRVMIVDDNADAARSLSKLLVLHGHEAHVSLNGTEALQGAHHFEPDVILLDIGLPDISGYEVAKRLKESGCPSTLIALSGFGQEEDKERAKQNGFDHYLTKPVSIADVLAIVRRSTRSAGTPHPKLF